MSSDVGFLQPDQIAQWLYGGFAYPAAYKAVVAESYAKQDQYAQIASHLPVPTSADGRLTILEAGPSNVSLLKQAMRTAGFPLTQSRLLGLDPYTRMHPPDLDMLTGSVTAIPLRDCSVDVVVMSSVLHFVTNKAEAIRECARVLKPCGVLILSEPDTEVTPQLSQKVMRYEIDTIWRRARASAPGWIGPMNALWALARRFVPRARHIRSAVRINRRIGTQQESSQDFTESEMSGQIRAAGISLMARERTYADVYFLWIGRKQAMHRP
jgi:ubiquinone/menaquinone biosynthesis C-methylase UbiE